ncbi:hypothetical protein HDU85_005884 [Gaertneriomyces sp. JEL0708]|nr:hypothetical protein HDU85_005884 [Gaertneriomyces sp. JEL0708]
MSGLDQQPIIEEENRIDDLAKTSAYQESRSWVPVIPLFLLAPVLVLIAVVSVVVPINPLTGVGTVINAGKESVDTKVFFYEIDPATRTVVYPIQSITEQDGSSYYTIGGLVNLGKVPATKRKPFFTVYDAANRAKVAFVVNLKFADPSDDRPIYTCSGGFRIDTTWNSMLLKARPSKTGVVALLDARNFTIAATSNNVISGSGITVTDGSALFDIIEPDKLTLALRESVYRKYNTFGDAASTSPSFYEDVVEGSDPWIIGSTIASMSDYSDESLLLVAAVPRSEIFGAVDAARSRSMKLSIGIAVAVAVLISCVYIAVVLPLTRLATAMETLTKLDFGTLEKSNVLESRSYIWELRKVQVTFATMVKALNKALAQRNATGGVSKLGGSVTATRLQDNSGSESV